MVQETGAWTVGKEKDDPFYFLESSDFTHDVRLRITGDFADDEQKKEYAQEIARRLNIYNFMHKKTMSVIGQSNQGKIIKDLLEKEQVAFTPVMQKDNEEKYTLVAVNLVPTGPNKNNITYSKEVLQDAIDRWSNVPKTSGHEEAAI